MFDKAWRQEDNKCPIGFLLIKTTTEKQKVGGKRTDIKPFVLGKQEPCLLSVKFVLMHTEVKRVIRQVERDLISWK